MRWQYRPGVTKLLPPIFFRTARELRKYVVTYGNYEEFKRQCPWVKFRWNTAMLSVSSVAASTPALSSCNKDCVACRGWNSYHPALLQSKFADPWRGPTRVSESLSGRKGYFLERCSLGEFLWGIALPFLWVTDSLFCWWWSRCGLYWPESMEGWKGCVFMMEAWAGLRVKPDQLGGSRSNMGSPSPDQGQPAGYWGGGTRWEWTYEAPIWEPPTEGFRG